MPAARGPQARFAARVGITGTPRAEPPRGARGWSAERSLIMGEYEPNDSRVVTRSTHTAPGEPPRTGPREGAARRRAEQDEDSAEAPREQDMGTAAAERGDPLGER